MRRATDGPLRLTIIGCNSDGGFSTSHQQPRANCLSSSLPCLATGAFLFFLLSNIISQFCNLQTFYFWRMWELTLKVKNLNMQCGTNQSSDSPFKFFVNNSLILKDFTNLRITGAARCFIFSVANIQLTNWSFLWPPWRFVFDKWFLADRRSRQE